MPPARRSSRRAWPPAAPCPGEHGIGLEKRDAMPLVFSPADLEAQKWLRDAFDPTGQCNPEKVLPRGGSRLRGPGRAAGRGVGVNDPLRQFAADVGSSGPVRAVGGRTQWDVGGAAPPDVRELRRPGRGGGPPAGRDDRPGARRDDPGRASSRRPRRRPGCRPRGRRPHPGDRGRDPGCRSQRLPAARARPGAGLRPGGHRRQRPRRADPSGCAAGQERDRLRPLPAAGRLARHARPPRRDGPALPARGSRPKPGGWPKAPTPSLWPTPCTGRFRCSGTAPAPGWRWPAMRPMCATRPPPCSVRASPGWTGPPGPPGPIRRSRPPGTLRGLPGRARARRELAGRGRRRDRALHPGGGRPAAGSGRSGAEAGRPAPGHQGALRSRRAAQPRPVGPGRGGGVRR